jgi:hypothetical protein|nr:MAG TPA: hypothetical protein [Caudoviricetes sp.]
MELILSKPAILLNLIIQTEEGDTTIVSELKNHPTGGKGPSEGKLLNITRDWIHNIIDNNDINQQATMILSVTELKPDFHEYKPIHIFQWIFDEGLPGELSYSLKEQLEDMACLNNWELIPILEDIVWGVIIPESFPIDTAKHMINTMRISSGSFEWSTAYQGNKTVIIVTGV